MHLARWGHDRRSASPLLATFILMRELLMKIDDQGEYQPARTSIGISRPKPMRNQS